MAINDFLQLVVTAQYMYWVSAVTVIDSVFFDLVRASPSFVKSLLVMAVTMATVLVKT